MIKFNNVTVKGLRQSKYDSCHSISKPWGAEYIWGYKNNKYAGKLLFINKRHKLSLQYHTKKDETILVLKGKLALHIGVSVGNSTVSLKILRAGDSYCIPAGKIHRFEAITDVQLVEVSTPELDDVIRLSDDYGRANEIHS